MKEFVFYTLLRVLLFLASLGVVVGLWAAINGGNVNLLWCLVIAMLVSGIASYFMLNSVREAFAQRVQARADAAAQRFDELKAREDEDWEPESTDASDSATPASADGAGRPGQIAP